MIKRFSITEKNHVVEVAANDGYLLQYMKAQSIPCTGIEPTASTAAAAREKGLEIIEDFFGVKLATKLVSEKRSADLMVANNVLAHVPDINDFVKGFATLLTPHGVATFEFPHVYEMVVQNQFDTIYHEHFSYLSLSSVKKIFEANGLTVFDVEEISTHGGSLRVFAQRTDLGQQPIDPRVGSLLKKEKDAGMLSEVFYSDFQAKTDRVRDDFVTFLSEAKAAGKKVAGYGAAAKGNTLMNYAGVQADLVSYVVDANPAKQGKLMPGSRVPIVDENYLKENRPDYIVIFPWNLKIEISKQLTYARSWNARLVTAVPSLDVQ